MAVKLEFYWFLHLLPEGSFGTLDVSFLENLSGNNGDVLRSSIIDIRLFDEFGNSITSLEEPLRICLEENGSQKDTGDLCLGFFDVEKNEWICEDECLEQEGSFYCGDTDHLTSFALLLDGGSGGGDPCSSSDEDYVLAWISLALVAASITFITIIIIIFEIRHRRQVKKMNAILEKRLLGEGANL
eukprot:CAMPEP_0206203140 /NCGR_PEP_ID=MMETSP0166-20121206/12633_1 /ASSEMBLY_ACC=CAM_ASM_000260 /TAXON_ID=95228 /ORGANISM="Vannella robusta, Strain DIVA3 518/3/11/1/6" /LENGTH=185 /DNA_ID=CAMNT_0053622283 /DNA_START=41 /DNA_END=598 /DNA_ORIENTATION=-